MRRQRMQARLRGAALGSPIRQHEADCEPQNEFAFHSGPS
jgi:hypothetical protein